MTPFTSASSSLMRAATASSSAPAFASSASAHSSGSAISPLPSRSCARRSDVPKRAALTMVTPLNDYLPQPRASPKGEHGFGGGRRRAAGAAGEHRRVPTPHFVEQRGGSCGETEREGFSAVLAGCAGFAPRNLGFTRGAPRPMRLRAFESRGGSARTLRQCSLIGGELSRSVPGIRIPPPSFTWISRGSAGRDFVCGERGIRTLGRLLTYARLASGYLRPLGHLSRRFGSQGGRERSRKRFGVKRDRWGREFRDFLRGFPGSFGAFGDRGRLGGPEALRSGGCC